MPINGKNRDHSPIQMDQEHVKLKTCSIILERLPNEVVLKLLPDNGDQERSGKSKAPANGEKRRRTIYPCHDCSYETVSERSLKLHLRVHTKPNLEVFFEYASGSPSGCGDQFHVSSSNVKRPRRGRQKGIQSDKQIFTCDTCSFSSKNIETWKMHILTVHCGLRPFSCYQCAYKAKTKSNLRTHMARHFDERPFACDQCDMRFKRKYILKNHIKMKHSEDRPFKCPRCDYRCKFRYLGHHLRTHYDERPFKCSFCAYTAKFLLHIRTHEREVHSQVKPFKCPNCTFRAKRNNLIKIHEKKCHARAEEKLPATVEGSVGSRI